MAFERYRDKAGEISRMHGNRLIAARCANTMAPASRKDVPWLVAWTWLFRKTLVAELYSLRPPGL